MNAAIAHNRNFLILGLISLMTLLAGCEAKLDLSGVDKSKTKPTARYDHYQAAAKSPEALVVIGNRGTVLISKDAGHNWNRTSLPGNSSTSYPTLLDIDVCPNNHFVILDADRKIWMSDQNGENWTSKAIPTEEEVLDLTCDETGALWVVGSFTLIMDSKDGGDNWTDRSIAEDAMFSRVQFVDRTHGVVTGEFGSVYTTDDGGESWQAANLIPNELYPIASLFISPEKGWVGGLQGTIYQTSDGGQNWERQKTGTVAPIYTIFSVDGTRYAIGEQGTILALSGDQWKPVGAQLGFGYLRAGLALEDGKFLVAGGGGMITQLDQKTLQ